VLSFALKFVLTVAVGSAALAGAVALLAPAGQSLAKSTTPLEQLDVTINKPPARTIVYNRFGETMGSFSTEDRQPVRLKDVPQVLINAVLSIEDRKFYEHHGVDWGGTVRALFKNVDAGGISQGGSTITQQLVKNALSTDRKRDLKTKVREAVLAIELEHQLTKNQILEDYLNLVYFGNGAYGVEAAAERYFGNAYNPKPLQHLNLAQAALLAGLIQSPEALNPIKHPDAAARRRNEVLDAMVANRKLTVQQATAAKSVPLPTTTWTLPGQSDYYLDAVRSQLLPDPTAPLPPDSPAKALGPTNDIRTANLYRGGLKIFTNYDPYLQYAAIQAVTDHLPSDPRFSAALVVIDNADGGVRAIANGRAYGTQAGQSKFDYATQAVRQPGSSFKAFTLAAALGHGYSPHDSVDASPVFQPQIDPAWSPLHDDCGGTPDLIHAIAQSNNCAFVRVEESLGPPDGHYRAGVDTVINQASSMGVNTSGFNPVVSTTLGVNGVPPIEMAQAYSVFPNDGMLKQASFISKIVGPDGKVLYQHNDTGSRVMDAQVARTEISMLKHVLSEGTAQPSLGSFIANRPAAGKTGTTDNHVDAWFVGFTPQFTAAVWMGSPESEKLSMNELGQTVWGGGTPAKIWGEFMTSATANLPPIDFAQPDESLWPRASFIDENGRRFTFSGGGPQNFTPATTPPTSAPTTPTTKKRSTTPTTKKGGTPPTTGGGKKHAGRGNGN
jgi:penicillin-binding protein 1A